MVIACRLALRVLIACQSALLFAVVEVTSARDGVVCACCNAYAGCSGVLITEKNACATDKCSRLWHKHVSNAAECWDGSVLESERNCLWNGQKLWE